MKHYLNIGVSFLLALMLVSCATHQNPFKNMDLAREGWQRDMTTSPSSWKRGADNWFLTGDPNATEEANRQAPYADAISTTVVNVADFSQIKVNGSFQVQIFGTYGHNSVYVYGPNSGVSNVAVSVNGDKLSIRQKDPNVPLNSMNQVIVRIGVSKLTKLIQLGCGTVEVIRVQSDALDIVSSGCGNIYLAGTVRLRRIDLSGTGSINVFNTATPSLVINSTGSGAININGNIGIQSIRHRGHGDINILGANTNSLMVDASGAGKISILGQVNLKQVIAKDEVCVLIKSVMSDCIDVFASDKARVGIEGVVRELHVNTSGKSLFMGRSLCAKNAFVRACDWSHINVTASDKVFALAQQNSTIYFFGPENLLSEFNSSQGSVIAMGNRNWCNYNSEYRPYSYTYSSHNETVVYGATPLRDKRAMVKYRGAG